MNVNTHMHTHTHTHKHILYVQTCTHNTYLLCLLVSLLSDLQTSSCLVCRCYHDCICIYRNVCAVCLSLSLCVCVYVCVCVCVFVLCVSVHMCVSLCACTRASMHVHMLEYVQHTFASCPLLLSAFIGFLITFVQLWLSPTCLFVLTKWRVLLHHGRMLLSYQSISTTVMTRRRKAACKRL